MTSKELISVLFNVKEIFILEKKENLYVWVGGYKNNETIIPTNSGTFTLLELSDFIKKAAWKNKWIISSGINANGEGFAEGLFGCITAENEQEAIIKAFEHIAFTLKGIKNDNPE